MGRFGRKWAPSKLYGISIVGMMEQIEATPEPKKDDSILKAEVERLNKQLETMTSRTVAAETKLKKVAAIVKGN